MKGGQKGRRVVAVTVVKDTDKEPKAFHKPYICTMGYGDYGTPFVWYQFLPANLYSHRVNVVYLNIHVNEYSSIKIPSEFFHCVRCKLMGSIKTLQEYTCV